MDDISGCTCNEELHSIVKAITPIVGYMTGIVIMEDEEKEKVRIFVGTKTAKQDVEMLLPTEHMEKISVEIVTNEKYG